MIRKKPVLGLDPGMETAFPKKIMPTLASDFLPKRRWIADFSDFGAVRIRRIRRRRKSDTSGRSPRSQAIAAHDVLC
jgi:hypothetical protein